MSYNIVILQQMYFSTPAEKRTVIWTDRIVQSKQHCVLFSPLHAAVYL